MSRQHLIDFEKSIADIYEDGHIKAPIHLRNGNEKQLIEIFKNIHKEDYVFSTWASHFHCLLKGVPEDQVKKDILEGRSITLHYPEYNFYSSAIVGGVASIAVGSSWALLNLKKSSRVWVFVGDMAFNSGVVNESIRYAIGHDLPITWVVEDNGKSVCTETEPTCGINTKVLFDNMYALLKKCNCKNTDLIYYSYETTYPHSGTGAFVKF
jgi:TPP-dependent pyruvate/acetoin dehydrogenase alpha subunit|tara:strand:+ start:4417 stop:5046 length:630 start_codon:yes stop_codon:yes gene_type:complete